MPMFRSTSAPHTGAETGEDPAELFARGVEALAVTVSQMGGLTESLLADAIEAIAHRDTALAEKTILADIRIDRMEREAESRSIHLLSLRQPRPADLRETLAALRIAADLERIGDLAKNVAKRTLVLNREPPMRVTQSLAAMGRQALAQLTLVLDAYAQRDPVAAQDVWQRDNEIDEFYNSLFRALLTDMMQDPRTIGLCAHLLFVAKNMERIGDHATNIAETIYYLVKGEYLTDERPKSDVTSTTSIPYEGKSGE